MNGKNIKILVGYHKKEHIYNNDMLIPIHCGRAVAENRFKNNELSEDEYNWLCENLIGDNTDDNISHLNLSLNEMTGIYWAWKNYDKIGNPDYIGFNHYRRYFDLPYSEIPKILNKYEFIKTRHKKVKTSFYDSWINEFGNKDFLDNAIKIAKEYSEDIEEFLHGNIGYGWCNMFILPKDSFFKYCEFIFPILLKLPHDEQYKRLPGMFAERLTSYFMYKLSKEKKAFNSSYTNILQANKKEYWGEHIFSIRKNKVYNNHIVLTLFGLKLKIKCQ